MHRLTKQIIYGVLFITIFSAVGGGIAYLIFKPEPTCFDNIQNQGETGVDCGGPCSAFCLSGVRPIELIGKVNAFYIDTERSVLLATVQNNNADLAARNFSYTFDIYDDEGKLLTSLANQSFIYAQEVKYLIVPNLPFSADKIQRINFTSQNPQWIPAREFRKPAVILQNYETRVTSHELEVSGSLLSEDTLPLTRAQVVALFYGQFGQIAGASATEIRDIGVGETRSFTILYPFIRGVNENINPSATKIFVFAYRP